MRVSFEPPRLVFRRGGYLFGREAGLRKQIYADLVYADLGPKGPDHPLSAKAPAGSLAGPKGERMLDELVATGVSWNSS
jgi:hypothetical protein